MRAERTKPHLYRRCIPCSGLHAQTICDWYREVGVLVRWPTSVLYSEGNTHNCGFLARYMPSTFKVVEDLPTSQLWDVHSCAPNGRHGRRATHTCATDEVLPSPQAKRWLRCYCSPFWRPWNIRLPRLRPSVGFHHARRHHPANRLPPS